MKALFIGGPCDGELKEIQGRRHEFAYPDGSLKIFHFHDLYANEGKRRWIFAAEEGTTDADIIDALVERYRKE